MMEANASPRLDVPSRGGDDWGRRHHLPLDGASRGGDDCGDCIPWTSPAAGAMIAVTASLRLDDAGRGGDDWGDATPFPWTSPAAVAMIGERRATSGQPRRRA